MKKPRIDDETYNEDEHFDKRHIRESRSKEKNEARRKIDAYLEKRSLKELLSDYLEDDYDYDWG